MICFRQWIWRQVPANVPIPDNVQATPPLLQLIAQLAHENNVEIVPASDGGDEVITSRSTDDSIEDT